MNEILLDEMDERLLDQVWNEVATGNFSRPKPRFRLPRSPFRSRVKSLPQLDLSPLPQDEPLLEVPRELGCLLLPMPEDVELDLVKSG